jgi:outer membrane lipoprotein SlyB
VSLHRLVISSVLAGWVACIAPQAHSRDAAPIAAGSLAIEGVDVEQVATLASGVPLRFTVFGTPRSLVALRIEGARRPLELSETDPGIYEGTYVIDAGDSIRPDSRVTASLQRAGNVAYSTLDEPLLLAAGSVPWRTGAAGAMPSAPVPVVGAPLTAPVDAPTSAPIDVPPSAPVIIVESRGATPVPIASARGRSPSEGVAIAAAPSPRELVPCGDCAIVESVQAVEAAPRGGVVGAIAGAIAGALLGKELGAEHTRRVLGVLGAVGGAFAGREIERQATRSTQYDVVLRRADGTLVKRRYEQAPPFSVGETIRLDTAARPGTRVPASL